MIAMRNDGASFGGLSHKLISPRARIILLSFIYFYLLLIAGAFGNVVVSTAIGLKAAPMAWLLPDHRRHPGRTDDLSLEAGYNSDHCSYGCHRFVWDISGNDRSLQHYSGSGLANSRPCGRSWHLSSATSQQFCRSGDLRCLLTMWHRILYFSASSSGLSESSCSTLILRFPLTLTLRSTSDRYGRSCL